MHSSFRHHLSARLTGDIVERGKDQWCRLRYLELSLSLTCSNLSEKVILMSAAVRGQLQKEDRSMRNKG